MLRIHKRAYPIIILYAVVLHLAWAVCGFWDDSAYNGTALSAIHAVFGFLTPYACIVVAFSALLGIEHTSRMRGLLLMLPQQGMLILSALSCIDAIVASHFADGIVRSRAFIAADQLPSILAATGHTIAIVKVALGRT